MSNTNIVKSTCQAFRGHAASAGLKNRNRERAATEFFQGAAQTAHALENKDAAAQLAYFIQFVIAVKGYQAIEEELKEGAPPQQPPEKAPESSPPLNSQHKTSAAIAGKR